MMDEPSSAAEAQVDSGLWAILSMAGLHGIPADPAKLEHEFGAPFNEEKILLAARLIEMSAKVLVQDIDRLSKAPLPAVAQAQDGSFFIVAKLIELTPNPEPNDPRVPTAKRFGSCLARVGQN